MFTSVSCYLGTDASDLGESLHCFLVGVNKNYVIATSDLWLFIHASLTPHPAPLQLLLLLCRTEKPEEERAAASPGREADVSGPAESRLHSAARSAASAARAAPAIPAALGFSTLPDVKERCERCFRRIRLCGGDVLCRDRLRGGAILYRDRCCPPRPEELFTTKGKN